MPNMPGVVVADRASGLLQAFCEKPEDPILAELAHTSAHASASLPYEANQGVYVFRRDTLLQLLADKDERTAHVQFGRDVLPAALSWGLTVAGSTHCLCARSSTLPLYPCMVVHIPLYLCMVVHSLYTCAWSYTSLSQCTTTRARGRS